MVLSDGSDVAIFDLRESSAVYEMHDGTCVSGWLLRLSHCASIPRSPIETGNFSDALLRYLRIFLPRRQQLHMLLQLRPGGRCALIRTHRIEQARDVKATFECARHCVFCSAVVIGLNR